jgi:hypothetical protein
MFTSIKISYAMLHIQIDCEEPCCERPPCAKLSNGKGQYGKDPLSLITKMVADTECRFRYVIVFDHHQCDTLYFLSIGKYKRVGENGKLPNDLYSDLPDKRWDFLDHIPTL